MLPSETIKQAIKDLKEPIIFTGFQNDVSGENNPEFLRWDNEIFMKIFGEKSLPFRSGDNAKTHHPQWDINCPTEYMTISEFFKRADIEEKWYYFDYKYMHQWFKDKPEILGLIDWKRFGFDKSGNDSTIWIGSKGAHTNCHQDSYGCNLVAQICGRKQWILFPPNSGDKIKPTRVPYEESTIYSKLNFFSPTKEEEEIIMRMKDNAKIVELEPGQVLFVPNGWWHYVESLNKSISINVWLPVDEDYEGRIKEAIVKLLVTNIGEGIPSAPDETQYSRRETINLIKTCLQEYKKNKNKPSKSSTEKRAKTTPWTAHDLANQYPNTVKLLPILSGPELRELIIHKRERFSEEKIPSRPSDDNLENIEFQKSLETVVDALCHFDIVNKVANILLDDKS